MGSGYRLLRFAAKLFQIPFVIRANNRAAWTFCRAHDSFHSVRDHWDAINRAGCNHLLLDSIFWKPALEHFASNRVQIAVKNGQSGEGIALVEPGRGGFWQTFQPAQSPLGPIMFDEAGAAHWPEHISTLMATLPAYPLGFSVTQQDPAFSCFTNEEADLVKEKLDYIETPRLTIAGSFEDYWKKRGKNLTHNLSRQQRRIKDRGGVLELIADRLPGSVARSIEEYGRLESTGWKGEEGTAVNADNPQGLFYRDVLQDFCARGEGVIYRLMLNGNTVASDLCLERNGTMVILKTAFDESVQGLSLGLLLHKEIFREVFMEGRIKTIEFYGRVRDWHTKWTDEIRTMYHVNFYRYRWAAKAHRFIRALRRCRETGQTNGNRAAVANRIG